jgi:hypothetical protein
LIIFKNKVDYTTVSTNPSNNEPHEDPNKFSQYSPATCGRGFFGYGLTLSLIFMTVMFFIGGTEQTFSKFYFSYLKFERFGISTGGASWGVILYWLSFSVRFIFFFFFLSLSASVYTFRLVD